MPPKKRNAPKIESAASLIASFRRIPDETPENMRVRPTQGMSPLIETLLKKYKIGEDGPEQILREHWSEIVGSANASYSHPLEINQRNSLIVLTRHPVIRNELYHHRAQLVKDIQKLPRCAHIRTLTLRAA